MERTGTPSTPETQPLQDVTELFIATPLPASSGPPEQHAPRTPAPRVLHPPSCAGRAGSENSVPEGRELALDRHAAATAAKLVISTPLSCKKIKAAESPWWKDIAFSPINGVKSRDGSSVAVVGAPPSGLHGLGPPPGSASLVLGSPAVNCREGEERAELVGEAILPTLPSPDISTSLESADGRSLQMSSSTLESIQRLSAWPVSGPVRKVVRQLEFVPTLEANLPEDSDGEVDLAFSDDDGVEPAPLCAPPVVADLPIEALQAALLSTQEAEKQSAIARPADGQSDPGTALGPGPSGRPLRQRSKTARAAESEEQLELERQSAAPRSRSPPRKRAAGVVKRPAVVEPAILDTCGPQALVVATAEKKRPPTGAGHRCCNCKKSRCLKLYCECFAAQEYCDGCNCTSCLNTPEHARQRGEAIDATRERNPHAFKPKIRDEGPARARHCKGCHCRKSGCQKKYCECFQAGVPCSDSCKCSDCRNCPSTSSSQSARTDAEQLVTPVSCASQLVTADGVQQS